MSDRMSACSSASSAGQLLCEPKLQPRSLFEEVHARPIDIGSLGTHIASLLQIDMSPRPR